MPSERDYLFASVDAHVSTQMRTRQQFQSTNITFFLSNIIVGQLMHVKA